ncbi:MULTISPECIES: hypothetical protein [unclassified Paenibacillus]|nr:MULTISPECIES: hypothetical protein [unclassified Paenibacillus]MBP1154298.1 hypothetical protein [Paenibacillus sp. PvP091]
MEWTHVKRKIGYLDHFLADRFRRLGIPLYIGLFMVMPLLMYAY